eukprot:6198030-Pleurochrysis_carterae.AAC.1
MDVKKSARSTAGAVEGIVRNERPRRCEGSENLGAISTQPVGGTFGVTASTERRRSPEVEDKSWQLRELRREIERGRLALPVRAESAHHLRTGDDEGVGGGGVGNGGGGGGNGVGVAGVGGGDGGGG